MKITIMRPLAFLVFYSVTACTDYFGSTISPESRTLATDPAGNSGSNQSGVITAGEWNDLEEWPFWTELMKNNAYSVHGRTWGFDVSNRYSVILKDPNNQPVQDAELILKNQSGQELWAGRSDNRGKAELWSGLFRNAELPSSVRISYQGQSFTYNDLTTFDQGSNEITLAVPAKNTEAIDVMLVVDATGSMGDELEYLKNELYDVLERVRQTAGNQLRTGSVFYRDRGDVYVTRMSPFTTNVNTTVQFVKNQMAGGGGDFPEAVHTALQKAVQENNWSSQARARLLFLMLDAPPHETPQVIDKLQQLIRQAAKTGIKIIPITASGIDKSTEFLMRFFSISTNGTYVFITNHSGIGNKHLEPTIGKYEVEYLNNLMVRLIMEYSE
jgi:hypothetical protein